MIELIAASVTIGALMYRNVRIPILVIVVIVGAVSILFVSGTRRSVAFSIVLIAACCGGAFLIKHADRIPPRSLIGDRTFEANVISVDRQLTESSIIVLDRTTKMRLQLHIGHVEVLPGDRISVRAVIEAPEPFETNTGRTFDYPDFLASKKIFGIGKNAYVRIEQRGYPSLVRVATILRFRIADTFSRYLSFPMDGVIAGMTVGYQGGIPDSIEDLFRNTGVLHVLVLSGYNITLVAGFLGVVLRWVPSKTRSICLMIVIIVLVVVSGSGVASVRAGIMGAIALFSSLSRRTYKPFHALALSYLFFFISTPLMIFYDPGFHLSFLATAFMVLALPKIEQAFSFLPQTRTINVRELLMLALSVPVFMLPYTMYFSGNVPLASPLANIVMAIVTPIFSIAAVLVLVCSWVNPLATIAGILLSTAGKFVLHLLALSSDLPVWNTPAISWWVVLSWYVLLFSLLFRREVFRYFWQLRNYLQQTSSSSDSENQ